jgi:ribosomal protein L7/L12
MKPISPDVLKVAEQIYQINLDDFAAIQYIQQNAKLTIAEAAMIVEKFHDTPKSILIGEEDIIREYGEVIKTMVKNQQKLEAIKMIHQKNRGISLSEAKLIVDKIQVELENIKNSSPDLQVTQMTNKHPRVEDIKHMVIKLIKENNKIEAVKLVKNHLGTSLSESKNIVETLVLEI